MTPPLLEIQGLRTVFGTGDEDVVAVDGVDLAVPAGRTLGLVGESGCGKTALALSVLGLVPSPPGRVTGRILFRGRDLLGLSGEALRRIRGRQISMIFQEPMTSLNPVFPVGEQIAEVVRAHSDAGRAEARRRAVELLDQVGLPEPERRARAFPHALSGGMRQRVMIAMALVMGPALLLADEPTTALDVTVEAQILDLVKRLQRERGMSVVLITHDLGIVAETCDDVAVMYAGRIVERAPVRDLFAAPAHPYTLGLMRSIPSRPAGPRARLPVIEGTVPTHSALPEGCRFRTRCPRADAACAAEEPDLAPAGGVEHLVACLYPVTAAGERSVS